MYLLLQTKLRYCFVIYDTSQMAFCRSTNRIHFITFIIANMSIQQKIDEYLEGSNFPQALALYDKNKHHIKASSYWYLRLAKVYYSITDYDKVIGIVQNISLDSPAITYETRALEFKANYLLGTKKCRSVLDELDKLTLAEEFTSYHRKVVKEFTDILAYRQSSKSKIELKTEGMDYQRLARLEANKGAESLQAFPLYLISRSWMAQWRKYVYLTEHELERNAPGPITQFEIMDHPYNVIHDSLPRKDYTNKYLINPADYFLISKDCWNFLYARYKGIPLIRYNICNFDKVNESMTEVYLKCVLVAKYDKPDEKFKIQISRRDTWKGLQEKIQRAWGKGRLWGRDKGKNHKIAGSLTLEEEEISNFEVIFQKQVNGKWPLGEQEIDSTNKCTYCGRLTGLKFCQCKKVKYCSTGCQNNHRPKHGKYCNSKSANVQLELTQLVLRYDLTDKATYSNNKGVVGLRNIGNSCYMNTGLQCLSNTQQLTEYFSSTRLKEDLNSSNPLGSNGYLACAYARLIRDLWSVKEDDISPWQFKRAFCKFAPQFSGFGQHDSQQFINSLLDGLHQDTNLIKNKPFIKDEDEQTRDDESASRISFENYSKRNKSFVSDLMIGQFKSTVKCPEKDCGKIAISFDPFMIVSLPIPHAQELEVLFVPKQLSKHIQKIVLSLSSRDTVESVANKLAKIYETEDSEMRMIELSVQFTVLRTFDPKDPAAVLFNLSNKDNYIFCYQIKAGEKGSKILYLVEYYDEGSRRQQAVTFPRFHHFYQNPDYEAVQDKIWKGLSEFNRNTSIFKPSQLFKLDIGSKTIKVILKESIKLRTYKENKTASDLPQEEITLNQCLELFCQDEKLDEQNQWYCNKCKVFVRANKKMDIYRSNRIVVLGLKRFRAEKKVKTFIKYPMELKLGSFILGRQQQTTYELYAVVNHFGSLLSGHYTAYCKNYLSGKWYEFNDSRVNSIRESEVITKNAYVLFYRINN